MSDIDEIPVESVGGSRPGSSTGDRLMVGLAALALLGGMLIAAGNALGPMLTRPAAARSPAPSAHASEHDGRTSRPTPTQRPLREVTLIPGEPPPVVAEGFRPSYWVEALAQLTVRSAPSDSASVMERLAPGHVVLAEQLPDDAGWFAIVDGAKGGFVRLMKGDMSLARTAVVAEGPLSGAITRIAAGPSGFVAHGWAPSRSYAARGGVTLRSADGEHWIPDDPSIQPGWGDWVAAWGPSGWLAVASRNDDGVASPWVWESPDGETWTPIGRMPVSGEGYLAGLVANDDGYLLALGSPTVNQGVLWFSPDGLTWFESGATGLTDVSGDTYFGPGGIGLLAVPEGFLTWIAADVSGVPPEVAFSRAGRAWETLPLDTGSVSLLQVTVAGGRVLAVGLDSSGRTKAWAGGVSDAGLEMEPTPSRALAFDGAVVTAVASDGARAYAFGYQRDATAARAWWSDGFGWQELPVPDGGFGAIPRVAAAGPHGVVVAGAQRNAVASSPILWHLGDDGRWVSEANPAIPNLPDPRRADCPPRPTTAYEFVTVDLGMALVCFGDTAITFVAWSAPCDYCWGGVIPSPQTPADWLMGSSPFLLLVPWDGSGEGGWWRRGSLPPDLTWQESWADTWVRVTGHYDDPAAAACGTGVEVGAEWWWEGPEAEVHDCRRTFVVTAVEVLGRNRR